MAVPLLLRWQGVLHPNPDVVRRLEWLAGGLLTLLLAGLPFFTRAGLTLLIAATGGLLLWSLVSPPDHSSYQGLAPAVSQHRRSGHGLLRYHQPRPKA